MQWNRGNFPKDKRDIFTGRRGHGYRVEINDGLMLTTFDLCRSSRAIIISFHSSRSNLSCPLLCGPSHLSPRASPAAFSRIKSPVLCGKDVTTLQGHPHSGLDDRTNSAVI